MNDEEKLIQAWNYVSEDLTMFLLEKEKELGVELFFPLLLTSVDALRLRGLSIKDIKDIVKQRVTTDLDGLIPNEDEKN